MLAIDFGTSRTKVSTIDHESRQPKLVELGREVRAILPSVFHVAPDGQIRAGDDAVGHGQAFPAGLVRRLLPDLHRTEPVLRSGHRIARKQFVSLLFSMIRQEVSRLYHQGAPLSECQIIVRSSTEILAREVLQTSALEAGFSKVHITETSVAAPASLPIESRPPLLILCDIGAEYSEFALLSKSSSGYRVHPATTPTRGSGLDSIDASLWDILLQNQDLAATIHADTGALRQRVRVLKESFQRFGRPTETFNPSSSSPIEIAQSHMAQAIQSFLKSLESLALNFRESASTLDISQVPLYIIGGGSQLEGASETLAQTGLKGPRLTSPGQEFASVLGAAQHYLETTASNSSTAGRHPETSPPPLSQKVAFSEAQLEKELTNRLESATSWSEASSSWAPICTQILLEWGQVRWQLSRQESLTWFSLLFSGKNSGQNAESLALDSTSISEAESPASIKRLALVIMKEKATEVHYFLRIHVFQNGRFWEHKVTIQSTSYDVVPSIVRKQLLANNGHLEFVLSSNP